MYCLVWQYDRAVIVDEVCWGGGWERGEMLLLSRADVGRVLGNECGGV